VPESPVLKISLAIRVTAVAVNLHRVARALASRAAIFLALLDRACAGRMLANIFVFIVSHGKVPPLKLRK
jgi:hypothetical protein